MFTKGKEIVRRIIAILLTVVMAFSLMPLESSIYIAAPQLSYEFTVTTYTEDDTPGEAIDGAVVTIVATDDSEITGTTGESVPGGATIDNSSSLIDEGCTYTVTAPGYKTVTGVIGADVAISVEMDNKVTVSGNVSGVADANLVLKENDIEITTTTTLEDGTYSFENLEIGKIYTIEVSKEGYLDAIETVDLTGASEDVVFDITFNEKTSVGMSYTNGVIEIFEGQTTSIELITDPEVLTGNYDISYSVDTEGTNVITVEKDETNQKISHITALSPGTALVTVTLIADDYLTSTATYTVNVNEKLVQSGFVFDYDFGETPATINLTYGDVVPTVGVTGHADGATLNYQSSDSTIASVDGSGVVSIHKAGEVTITVISDVPDNSDYKDAYLTYKIVIAKAPQTIGFAQDVYEIINGESFVAPEITSFSTNEGSGAITYRVISNIDNVVSLGSEDDAIGTLPFTYRTGEVTILATRAECDRFLSATDVYTLKVNEWDPFAGGVTPDTYYTITGTKTDDTTDWYTSPDVKVVAKSNYELYATAPTPDMVAQGGTEVEVSANEGEDNGATFYIRNTATGYISKQCLVTGIKLDTVAPTATIKVQDTSVWSNALYFFTFGSLGQNAPKLTITASDATPGSDVKEVYYYVAGGLDVITDPATLESTITSNNGEWNTYTDAVTLSKNDLNENVIYVKVYDCAGKVYYGSTKGLIFDSINPIVTSEVKTTHVTTSGNDKVFNTNVEIEVDVVDEDLSSGIKSVSYEVITNGAVSSPTFIYSYAGDGSEDLLDKEWNSVIANNNIVVNAASNNGVVDVKITVKDNAGNIATSTQHFIIDTKKPVVSVSYDNNTGDASYGDNVFFNSSRTATITITDANLDIQKTKVSVTNTDGTLPAVSNWSTASAGVNKEYKATVVFSADGDYTLDVSCEDIVGYKNEGVDYGGSQAPTKFTIDKTAPTITVSYDNIDALNNNYFKTDRRGTITVYEHNFDSQRFNSQIIATDNGQPIAAPVISGWSSSGNTHTATIVFNADGYYKVDFTGKDRAGNQVVEYVEQDFYIDKTNPELTISQIANNSANSDDVISLVITSTDTNFDIFTAEIEAVVKTETDFSTISVDASSISDITNGKVLTIDNLAQDGIYTVHCNVIDKAGNAFSEVILEQEDGSTYVESHTSEDVLITFSVNRNGSVFEPDSDYAKNILENYYVYSIDEDIVIYEVNTNELISQVVSLNGEELTEGSGYNVTSYGGDGSWMRYTYTIEKELFKEEGEYNIVIASTDLAENDAFSDVKEAGITFVVDRTAPVVTVTGLESNGNYQTDTQEVTLMPTDDGGMLNSLLVRSLDNDGNVLEEFINLSGEELINTLSENQGTVSFVLKEGLNQNIQIICSDSCVGIDGKPNTYEVTYNGVSISASAVAIFFANDAILYAGIGGVAVIGATVGVIFFRKRKGIK